MVSVYHTTHNPTLNCLSSSSPCSTSVCPLYLSCKLLQDLVQCSGLPQVSCCLILGKAVPWLVSLAEMKNETRGSLRSLPLSPATLYGVNTNHKCWYITGSVGWYSLGCHGPPWYNLLTLHPSPLYVEFSLKPGSHAWVNKIINSEASPLLSEQVSYSANTASSKNGCFACEGLN